MKKEKTRSPPLHKKIVLIQVCNRCTHKNVPLFVSFSCSTSQGTAARGFVRKTLPGNPGPAPGGSWARLWAEAPWRVEEGERKEKLPQQSTLIAVLPVIPRGYQDQGQGLKTCVNIVARYVFFTGRDADGVRLVRGAFLCCVFVSPGRRVRSRADTAG